MHVAQLSGRRTPLVALVLDPVDPDTDPVDEEVVSEFVAVAANVVDDTWRVRTLAISSGALPPAPASRNWVNILSSPFPLLLGEKKKKKLCMIGYRYILVILPCLLAPGM
jgi:hypothetical protein